ncbi:DMT family transporter [Dongia sedimenti]|uniref:DMT family transporter n=1 Tax=Dongia sedimenti TaxID=3064282 RepID=A0ABU0YHL6_9PROT|nr:DMT family transporter [Rhodospirillaceae bacterium R-7]
MPPLHILLAVLIQVLWGPCYTLTKPIVGIFPPLMLVAMVYSIVALLFTPLVPRAKTPRRTLFLIGFFGGALQTSMVFLSLKYLPASTAVLAMQMQLPVAVVASWFMGRDKPNLKNTIGSIVCLIGVAIVVGRPEATDAWFGLAAMLVGVISWSVTQAVIPVVAKDQGMTLYAAMARYAAPQMIVMSLLFESGQWQVATSAPLAAWAAVPAIALLGFALPYAIWYWLLMRHRVDELTPFLLLMPVFGVVVAATQLGEPLPASLLLGGAVVIAGLAVIVIRRGGRGIGQATAPN